MTSPAGMWAPVVVAREPPDGKLPRFWIDVSNYQGNLDDNWFRTWGSQGFAGLIVQAVTGMDGISYTRQQCNAALEHGWALAAYVWCSPGDADDQDRFQSRLALLGDFVDELDFLALDLEESSISTQDVDTDLDACDDVVGDAIIYTGKWFFDQQGWSDDDWWADRRLWCSDYDGVADVDHGFVPFGGWTQQWIKQYTANPLDQNVMRL